MYPARILSLNNGWKNFIEQNAEEWQDIQQTLLEMTPEIVKHPSSVANNLSFAELPDSDKYNVYQQIGLWDVLTEKYGWKSLRVTPRNKGAKDFYFRNLKNKVSCFMLSCDGLPASDLTKNLLMETPIALDSGLCKHFVALVPSEDVENLFYTIGKENDIFKRPFLEAECRAQVAELLPISDEIPYVIVFYSQYPQELAIEELYTPSQDTDEGNVVQRVIEFAPEYYQAGVGILSYFGEVLRKKHPEINAKVRIEQVGTIVRMQVESPAGDIEIIEKELQQYALVVAEQASPESMYTSAVDVLALKNKLEITQLEVRQAHDLLQLTRDLSNQNVFELKQEVTSLRQQIGMQLAQTGVLINLVGDQVASSERIQLAQIGHSNALFKDLLGEAQGNQIVLNAIRSLEYNLMAGINTIDAQDRITDSLAIIQQGSPVLLTKLAVVLENSSYGVLGNIAYEWLKSQ